MSSLLAVRNLTTRFHTHEGVVHAVSGVSFTVGLLGSLPRRTKGGRTGLTSIPGQPPGLVAPGPGCPFAPRCRVMTVRCLEENPALEPVAAGHQVACWERGRMEGVWDGV